MIKNLFYLIGGMLLGLLLAVIGFTAFALVSDAVAASDRETGGKWK